MNIVLKGIIAPSTFYPVTVPCIRIRLHFLSACTCFFYFCHVLFLLSVTVVAIGTLLDAQTTFAIVRCNHDICCLCYILPGSPGPKCFREISFQVRTLVYFIISLHLVGG